MVCYGPAIKLEPGWRMMWKLQAAVAAAILGAAPVGAQTGFQGAEFVTAVRSGDNGKALQLLADNPRIINARSSNGETALFVAVSKRDSDWAAYLINKDADPNLASQSGDTPLIAAARIGFTDAITWLISAGAKIDAANRMGETPLIVAIHNRRTPIIRLLLEKGADPDRTDTAAGLSARDYAKRDTRSRDILKLIEAKKPKL